MKKNILIFISLILFFLLVSINNTNAIEICENWSYSNWEVCVDGIQTRKILSYSPMNCIGGNPVTEQECAESIVCTSWGYSDWGQCINGVQKREIYGSPPDCIGGEPPLSEISCTVADGVMENKLYFISENTNFKAGNMYNASLYFNPGDYLVSALLIKIDYDVESIKIHSIKNSNSIIKLWSEEPSIYSSGLLKMSGGNSEYLKKGVVFEINFEILKEDCIEFNLNENFSHALSGANGIPFNYEVFKINSISENIFEDKIENSLSIYIKNEKSAINEIDKSLTKKLKGRILLQVEEHGQAWYVCPKDEKKYYMANGNEAYNIMRNFGVGITNLDLDKIKNDKNFAKKHSGKIFLQIEAHGEAYYIDIDGNTHYLKNGDAAYTAMRNLGLGITNSDIRKIDVGEI